MTRPPTLPAIFRLIGSKTRQRKNILPILAKYPRTLYVEPFGGAGGLFFGKPPERAEVYNDANRAFANLMRVVADCEKFQTLKAVLDASPFARDLWYEARDITRAYVRNEPIEDLKKSAGLEWLEDDVVAAVAAYYVQNCGFGGKLWSAFGVGEKGTAPLINCRGYFTRRERLEQYHARLSGVTIETGDALECIRRHDSPTTLFYLDPPYNCRTGNNIYKLGSFKEDALVECLKGIKGRFVLSCYDTEKYEELKPTCLRYEFDAYSSVSKDSYSCPQYQRREVVYASPSPTDALKIAE